MKLINSTLCVSLLFPICILASGERYLSPCDLDTFQNGAKLLVTEHTGQRLDVLDTASGKVERSVKLKGKPNGSAYSRVTGKFYVAMDGVPGLILEVDAQSGTIRRTLKVGHTPVAPVVSPDGKQLYICLRFDNAVGIVDLERFALTKTVAVAREPVAMAVTPDGSFLYVANHLPAGPADASHVASRVSVIDVKRGELAASIELANGAEGMRGICVSPDGNYVFATHLLARHQVPTTQVERGWINTAAVSVIRVADQALIATALLDDVALGFANPWAVTFTADGARLVISSAGTHEIRDIDLQAFMAKVAAHIQGVAEDRARLVDPSNDLTFMSGVSQRIRLAGNGPRALAVAGGHIYAAEYFTDSLSKVSLGEGGHSAVEQIELGPRLALSEVRKGEMLFNDAELCFQKWQSCASCHSDDGRTDGLNWDLLNDGMGNPKNAKSLLFAHRTAPTMALGVRADAETAVRAGIKFIQFAVRPESDAQAIDAYLKSLEPVPSPRLVRGKLSKSAKRGKKVFDKASCIVCHPGELYTDLRKYDVGTGKGQDQGRAFDVPVLNEVWRTAPYLHDGRATTIYDLFKIHNPDDRHGVTSRLSETELRDLSEYVESL